MVTTTRRKAQDASSKTETAADTAETDSATTDGAVKDLLLRAGHTQVAAMTAASRFWAEWAAAADRYAQALGTEICDAIEGRTKTGEMTTRFADATSSYLQDMTELPGIAVDHFNEQLAKEPRNRGPRIRRTRTKT